MRLLFKLLRQNVSVGQILGFVFVNLLGGLIVLLGVQGYNDFDSFSNSGDNILSSSHIVVTKPVTTAQTFGSVLGVRPKFSKKEIEELEALSSVSAVGEFVPAQFEVKVLLSIGNSRVSSDIFLEAVPDEFILSDYKSLGGAEEPWSAGVDSKKVPIILPRNYINLYNFGYATANGMPQISDELLSSFPVRLQFSTEKGKIKYDAVVCGLTSKINTILVPWDFMLAINEEYAPGEKADVSRIIINTKANETDDSLLDFIAEKGYVIEGDASHMRLQSLVFGIIFVVIGVGALFSILAFFMLVISILLLIEKNKEKITNLYSMGYSVRQVARTYELMVLVVDTVVWLVAATVATVVYPGFSEMIENSSPGFEPASLLSVWVMALLLTLLFVSLHCMIIHRQVKKHCVKK